VCKGGVVTTSYRRISVNAAAWLAGAAASVAVGIVALSQIDDGLGDAGIQPLGPDSVITVATGQPAEDQAVPSGGATPSGSATPSGGKTPSIGASPSGDATEPPPTTGDRTADAHTIERVLTSRGGSLVAWCSAGRAYLASWSPAQGYHADDVRRGPAVEARLIFQGAERDVTVAIRCIAGVPEASIQERPAEGHDDHGDGD
jgi:hypothetical protein